MEIKNWSHDDVMKTTPSFSNYIIAVNLQKNRGQMIGQEVPKRVMFYGGAKYNQYEGEEYTCAGGHFAIANAISAMNMTVPEAMALSWKRMKDKYGANENDGSTMTQNLNRAITEKYIDNYYLCTHISEIKVALSLGYTLLGSCSKFNWERQAKNGFMFVPYKTKGSDYFVSIVGYDDEMILNGRKGFFVCLDNRGPEAWNNGYFYVQYTDIVRYWGSVVALVKHSRQIGTTRLEQDMVKLSIASRLRLWDGKRQKGKVSYYECMIMVIKALAMGKKINEEKAIYTAETLGLIPNRTKIHDTDMYRQDVIAMIMRAMYSDRELSLKIDLIEIAFHAGLWDGTGRVAYASREWTILTIVDAIELKKEKKI